MRGPGRLCRLRRTTVAVGRPGSKKVCKHATRLAPRNHAVRFGMPVSLSSIWLVLITAHNNAYRFAQRFARDSIIDRENEGVGPTQSQDVQEIFVPDFMGDSPDAV